MNGTAHWYAHADMAEVADAPDLGSGGRPCRFKSCYPHCKKRLPHFGAAAYFV